MESRDQQDSQQSAPSEQGTQPPSPPGSSTLGSSPPTRSPADNPVRTISRDTGDVLADNVRDGKWTTPEEERDNAGEG